MRFVHWRFGVGKKKMATENDAVQQEVEEPALESSAPAENAGPLLSLLGMPDCYYLREIVV